MGTLSTRFLFLATTLTSFLRAEIRVYDNVEITGSPYPNYLYYEPMFNLHDSPNPLHIPYIKYNLTLSSAQPFQIAFLVIGKRDQIIQNGKILHKVHVCDSSPFSNNNLTKILIKFDNKHDYTINGVFYIRSSGLYSSFFLPCGKGIAAHGYIEYQNPYGSLPGNLYFYIHYYNILFVIYLLLLAIWGCAVYFNRSNLSNHHRVITAIICITLCEALLNYFELIYVNNNGFRNSVLYFTARMFSVLRKTFIRAVVVLVCYGYGVLELRLSKLKHSLIKLITSFYFLANVSVEIYLFENSRTTEHVDVFLAIFKALNVLSNCVFFAIIFVALSRTLEDLKCRERYYLRLYNYFALLLALLLVTTAAFFFMEFDYYNNKMLFAKNWRRFWWYKSGFRMLQNTLVLAAVIYVWWPSGAITYRKVAKLSDLVAGSEGENVSFGEDSVGAIDADNVLGKKAKQKGETEMKLLEAQEKMFGEAEDEPVGDEDSVLILDEESGSEEGDEDSGSEEGEKINLLK